MSHLDSVDRSALVHLLRVLSRGGALAAVFFAVAVSTPPAFAQVAAPQPAQALGGAALAAGATIAPPAAGTSPAATTNGAVGPAPQTATGPAVAPPATNAAPPATGALPATAVAAPGADNSAGAQPATASAPAAPPAPARSSHLPHELSPFGMFLSADIVVQGVMIGLMLSSVAVWAVWLAKLVELWTGKRRLRVARAALGEERSLAGISADTAARSPIVSALVGAAAREIKLSSDAMDREGLKTRIASRLAEVSAAAARRIRIGTGLLASVGATAPFVGLFGTVWGIMNSFIGISKSQTTNLAVVAPGIAEALLATAIGLVAAIPAVLFYNHLSRGIASYKALLGEVTAEIERIVSRDLDRAASGPHHLRSARAAE